MSTVEQYIGFLDNKLSFEEEEQFASQFASNPEFRTGFKGYLAITATIRKNVNNIEPPNSMTDNIFSKLGITIPVVPLEPIIPAVTKVVAKPSFFKGRWFTGLATALVSICGTAAFFLNMGFGTPMNSNGIASHNNSVIHSGFSSEEPIAQVMNKSVENRELKNRSISRQNISSTTSEEKETTSEVVSPPQRILIRKISNDQVLSELMKKNNSIPVINFADLNLGLRNEIANKLNSTSPDQDYGIDDFLHNMQFELKNTPSWFLKPENVQPSVQNRFNNMDLTLSYIISPHLLIGGNFRQETFLVQYEGTDQNGRNATYYQQPNLSTFCAMLRYHFNGTDKLFSPVGQINFGGNSNGMVAREMAGIEINAFDNAFILIGCEYNQYLYSHDKKWFLSSKVGLNYGIGVKF